MKKPLLSIWMLFITVVLQAAPPAITGKIVDENNAAIPFATIALYQVQTDTNMVKATFSDESGQYTFSLLAEGNYYLEASFIGYAKSRSELITLTAESSFNAPILKLISKAEALDEVEVTAERELIELKPDKTVFNVQGSINATGNTAFELLRKSPGVVIDNNENLMLQGKSGVLIYIDGKRSPLRGEDLANFLSSLQSNEIDAIEIITEPSAKYDAEGNAGIINIRLIKDKNLGTNGALNLGYRYGLNSKYNGSVNFNNRNKTTNVFGSLNAFTGESEENIYVYREQGGNGYNQYINQLTDKTTYGYKLGADFFLSKHSTVGLLVNGNTNDQVEYFNSEVGIFGLSDHQTDSFLVAANTTNAERNNANFNINYVFNNLKGKSLTVDLDYGQFRNRSESFQPNIYLSADRNTMLNENIYSLVTPTDIDIYTAKLDWESKLFDGTFGTGVKSSFVRTDNTFDYYDVVNGERQKDEDQSNRFTYDEFVNAAYISFQKKLGERWNLMTGLRVEHTQSEGTLTTANPNNDDPPVKRDYLNWFPSAGLTYTPNQKHSFRLNYSRRVDRPNYQNLNPFEMRADELTFSKGNPFLNPQFSNSLTLSHTYNSMLSTSLNYTVIDDMATMIVQRLDENKIIANYVNLAQQTNLALTISYPFTIKDWWNVFATFTGFRLKNEAVIEGTTIDLATTSFRFYAQNNFMLPKGFRLELSGWYNSSAIWGGNILTDPFYDISAGISKQILKGKGNFKLSVSDLFLTNPWSTENSFDGMFTQASGKWESRQVRFNFSYRFGSNTVKKERKRQTGLEELKKRATSK